MYEHLGNDICDEVVTLRENGLSCVYVNYELLGKSAYHKTISFSKLAPAAVTLA